MAPRECDPLILQTVLVPVQLVLAQRTLVMLCRCIPLLLPQQPPQQPSAAVAVLAGSMHPLLVVQ